MSSCSSWFCLQSGNCCSSSLAGSPPRPLRDLGSGSPAPLSFSVPTWTYFVFSDSSARGATIGKWLLGLRVTRVGDGAIGMAQALKRTAVKLLPWETTHLSAFAFSAQPGVSLDIGQLIGLTTANVLIVVYFVVAAYTGGRRSVHDYVAATAVCPSMAKRNCSYPQRRHDGGAWESTENAPPFPRITLSEASKEPHDHLNKRRAMTSEQFNQPANTDSVRQTSAQLRRWGRPLGPVKK